MTEPGLPPSPSAAETPPAAAPPPAAPSKIWKPWPTIGLGAAIFAGYTFAQMAVIVVYLVIRLAQNPSLDLADVETLLTGLMTNGLLLSLSVIASAIVGMALVWVFIRVKHVSLREYLGFNPISRRTLIILVVIPLALTAAEGLLNGFVFHSTGDQSMVEAYKNSAVPALFWISVVIFAPIFEETFFRGFLFVGLVKSRIGAAGTILFTAVAWAALHIQYDLFGISVVFVLGVVLGVVRLKTGSLMSTILVHSIWNLIAMALTALAINI